MVHDECKVQPDKNWTTDSKEQNCRKGFNVTGRER